MVAQEDAGVEVLQNVAIHGECLRSWQSLWQRPYSRIFAKDLVLATFAVVRACLRKSQAQPKDKRNLKYRGAQLL